ncbi:MAG: hypothetical protein GF388_00605 [Candidatus Aegiribacteria sp.]|nr:hypothetical protein [Candidatus Aegiribacteria sp.]MBD3293931.1 hypothetical protein [Candidatus Fermentibacteria bacterium]
MIYEDLKEAVREAGRKAENLGEPFCVVSGFKKGVRIFRLYPMKGFGLPPGGTLEKVVNPVVEREDPEPPEKISSNGF